MTLQVISSIIISSSEVRYAADLDAGHGEVSAAKCLGDGGEDFWKDSIGRISENVSMIFLHLPIGSFTKPHRCEQGPSLRLSSGRL